MNIYNHFGIDGTNFFTNWIKEEPVLFPSLFHPVAQSIHAGPGGTKKMDMAPVTLPIGVERDI